MTKLSSAFDGRKSPNVPKLINSNVRGSKQGWKKRVNSQLAGNSGVVVGKCRKILPKLYSFGSDYKSHIRHLWLNLISILLLGSFPNNSKQWTNISH